MAQSEALVKTLKQALKARGLTYAKVAAGIKMSEASVKRMFASGHISLQRLDRICALVEIELTDLLRLHEESQHRISHLEEEQEKELVRDPRRLLVAICVRGGWSVADIVDHYDFAETECIRHLAALDRFRIIDLLPGNRIRLRVAKDFRWLPHGPIELFFREQAQTEFLGGKFDGEGRYRRYLSGMLSEGSRQLILRKLDELSREFSSHHQQDLALPLEKRMNVGLMFAYRPWEFSLFRKMRRNRQGVDA